MLNEEELWRDVSENEAVVVELNEEQRTSLAEYARQEHRQHEVHTVCKKATQDLKATRRSRGFFPVEAMDTGYKVNNAENRRPRLLDQVRGVALKGFRLHEQQGSSIIPDLGHSTLLFADLISAILPSDEDLGHATPRVVDLISASLYPLFLCPVLVRRSGLLTGLCLRTANDDVPAVPRNGPQGSKSAQDVAEMSERDDLCCGFRVTLNTRTQKHLLDVTFAHQ